MKLSKIATLDFETEAIGPRPEQYPPKPVGCSIRFPGNRKSRYFAWGHPTNNNCMEKEFIFYLSKLWHGKSVQLLFHNSKFDIEVVCHWYGLPMLSWQRVHDTLYLLSLVDPYAMTLSLKPSAERLLDWPPEEKNELDDWIRAHVYTAFPGGHGNVVVAHNGQKPPGFYKVPPTKTGAFICHAPGDLVGRYACGDTDRTYELFKRLYSIVEKEGMLPAYDRERKLMPILLRNEQQGIRVNKRSLKRDTNAYRKAMVMADSWLAKKLSAKGLNVDADEELAEALEKSGVVTEWVYTEKSGQRSVSKDNLTVDKFNDKKVFLVLGYRNRLQTCLSTFMQPWLDLAETTGRIYTSWNQVRQSHSEKHMGGARTGRLSSRPNFMNIPKNFEDRGDGYKHPAFLRSLPPLPLMRQYLLPNEGDEWVHRDYSQQELRILAHFEGGALMREFLKDPTADGHTLVQNFIRQLLGIDLPRRDIKNINFGVIYGMGLASLAARLAKEVDEVRQIKRAHSRAFPDVEELNRDLKKLPAEEPIVTWGGRCFYLEPPRLIKGKMRSFEYKRLNTLVQGSAAECTKEAIINYDSAKKHGRFLVSVHDENNISAKKGHWREEAEILRECMESIEFDVPMLTDLKHGRNWGVIK